MLKHLHFKMVVSFFFFFETSITICREVRVQCSFRILNKYSHYNIKKYFFSVVLIHRNAFSVKF